MPQTGLVRRLLEAGQTGAIALVGPKQIDLARLPPEVRAKVVKVSELSGDEVNSVMADVGAAALGGLLRAGVHEEEIYGMVDRIQQAVKVVLTDGAVQA